MESIIICLVSENLQFRANRIIWILCKICWHLSSFKRSVGTQNYGSVCQKVIFTVFTRFNFRNQRKLGPWNRLLWMDLYGCWPAFMREFFLHLYYKIQLNYICRWNIFQATIMKTTNQPTSGLFTIRITVIHLGKFVRRKFLNSALTIVW